MSLLISINMSFSIYQMRYFSYQMRNEYRYIYLFTHEIKMQVDAWLPLLLNLKAYLLISLRENDA